MAQSTTRWIKVTVQLPHLWPYPQLGKLIYHQHLNLQQPTTWEDLTLGATKVVQLFLEEHRAVISADHYCTIGDLTVDILSQAFPGRSVTREDWPHVLRHLMAQSDPELMVWFTHASIWHHHPEDPTIKPHQHVEHAATEHKLLYPLSGGATAIPLSISATLNLAILITSGTSLYLSEHRLHIPAGMSHQQFLQLIHRHAQRMGLRGHAVLDKLCILDIREEQPAGSVWDLLKVHGHTVVAQYTVHGAPETVQAPCVLEFPPLTPQSAHWLPRWCCVKSKL
jgi:hypothetical protein